MVGDPGLEVLERRLPLLIKEKSADFVVVNGENAAGGFGLTAPVLARILAAGADVVSGGNHIFEQREFWPVLESEERILRPMNYPDYKSIGRGWVKIKKPYLEDSSINWIVVNIQGRELMSPLDCPFRTFDSLREKLGIPAIGANPFSDSQGHLPEHTLDKSIILVDFHAESTREKEAMAYYLDGHVSVLAGTHTHVQTADERILPNGSAYITDLGLCGVIDGVIGMDAKICLDRARNQVLYRMEVAKSNNSAIQGIIVEIDGESRKALSIQRLSLS